MTGPAAPGAPGRRPRAAASLPLAALALIACLAACATAPGAGGAPAAPAPALPGAGPQPEGTSIRTADPSILARAREERAAIEAALVFGSPASLARVGGLAAAATSLKPGEARAFTAAAAAVVAIVYPKPSVSTDAPLAPEAPGAEKPGLLERALAEAAAGKLVLPPADPLSPALDELVPALALFVSPSRDIARVALEAVDRFARLGQASILPELVRGLDAERRGDAPSALERYERALELAPDAWPARLGRGRVLLGLGRSSEALDTLSPLQAARGGTPAFSRVWAQALYENGRYDESEGLVARALVSDPQDSVLLLIRAHLLVRARAFQQAIPLLDAYGTVDSANRLYILLRCLAAEGLRNREEALKWARRGLGPWPDDIELLTAAARILLAGPSILREEGRLLARRAWELARAAKAAPSAPRGIASPGASPRSPAAAAAEAAAGVEAARLLAIDEAARYEWEAAAEHLAWALGAGAFDDRALAAAILRRAGRAQEALDYAQAWQREAPGQDAAAEALLRALAGAGKEKETLELAARLLPSAAAPAFRSAIYYVQSRLQKSDDAALALLRSALFENADNPEALAAMSDILARRKDWAKARFYLRQALSLAPGDPDLARRSRELETAAGASP